MLRKIWRFVKIFVGILLFIFLVQRSTYPTHITWNAIALVVSEYKFDYLRWEVEALWSKATQAVSGQHHYMDEATRSQFVRDYMDDLEYTRRLEAELDRRFLEDSRTDLSALQTERDALRRDLSRRQSTVEAILESQIAAVLIDEGFGTLGQLFPPVSMRFTQMPNLLVVSPRDAISRQVELAITPLSLAERAEVERRVESVRDVSALVVPLGGMALFPAMIQEATYIPWILDTFAHEWVHHYFFFFPLGLSYFVDVGGSPEALIINETVADMFGREIAAIAIERYYPEFSAFMLRGDYASYEMLVSHSASEFDYGATMHETRVNVDHIMGRIARLSAINDGLHRIDDAAIIAKNQTMIDELTRKAEGYMEHRRQIFVANGFNIRRLNQAYFAFYGGYQGGIPGIGGQDPIGPAVMDIREASDSLHDFVITMRSITTRAELLNVRDSLLVN